MPHGTRLRTNIGPALSALCAQLSSPQCVFRNAWFDLGNSCATLLRFLAVSFLPFNSLHAPWNFYAAFLFQIELESSGQSKHRNCLQRR